MSNHDAITAVSGAIHNPADARHFMTITPAPLGTAARAFDVDVARSDKAVVVKEVGRAIYDPVVYFPRADVHMDLLRSIDRTTHCPLKGDTEYFDVVSPSGDVAEAAAWSYVDMTLGDELQHLIAFDARTVTVGSFPG